MKYNSSKYEKYYYWIIVFFISIVVSKIMLGLHSHNFASLCAVEEGVTTGKPHWIAYQNRILGPYLVEGISYVGNFSYCKALKVFNIIMILMEYFVLYFLLLKFSKDSYSLSLTYLVYFSLMLLGIQHYWSYTWDYIDIIVFTVFTFFIFTNKPTKYFVLLFLIEILNRESALFIALFLIIDSFHYNLPIRNFGVSLQNRTKLLIGSFLLIIGIIYIKFIREFLFIESMMKNVGTDASHRLIGNHIQLINNLKVFFINFTNINFINSIFIMSILIYLLANIKRFNEVQLKALILFMSLLSSIFLLGLINETRMFTIILPFLIFFHLSIKEKKY